VTLDILIFITNMVIWTVLHFPGCQIYVNSLLAVVNARHYISEHAQTTQEFLGLAIPLQDLNDLRNRSDSITQYVEGQIYVWTSQSSEYQICFIASGM